jgi:hypothetical protein
MDQTERERALWRNCTDSVVHALEHFNDAAEDGEDFHHRKWTILSVDHAAEVYCNLLRFAFDPTLPDNWYPDLCSAAEELESHPRLLPSERFVIGKVLPVIRDARNTLMHGPAPEDFTLGDTAIALLSLLFILRRRIGITTDEFMDQSPRAEHALLESLNVEEIREWTRIAEYLTKEEYGDEHLSGCDNCGGFTVPPDMPCQSCFHED